MTSLACCSAATSASGADGLCLFGDRPDEACQFARDRSDDHGRRLACPRELAISPTQPFLRLPCRVADRLGQTLLSQQLLAADPRREPIAPGGLDQHPPRRTVAGLGDPTLAPRPT